jgi:DNA-binding Lrp family transcriptional regulator
MHLKEVEVKLICELIRNTRKSDRELAKLIGVSQPTVSRIRGRLEKEGVIEYAGVPDLRKLGFEIIAVTFGNSKNDRYTGAKVTKSKAFIDDHPNLIFVSCGRGLSSDRIAISVHKSYSDYAEYVREIRSEWAEFMTMTDSFLIALNSDDVPRPLSLKYIAECLEKEKPERELKAK